MASKSSPPPKGIYVPSPTFFAAEGTSSYNATTPPLDLESQTKHSLFLVKGGIRGLVILGSTGEAIHLTNAERTELISSQRKALDENGFKDRPIIAGTATQNVEETITMIKESKEAGAEYAMVLAPGYFAPAASQQGIQKWFEAVADAAALPVMMFVFSPPTPSVFES
jgi:2-keto-3-deoxy-L-rhamnonate aldolase